MKIQAFRQSRVKFISLALVIAIVISILAIFSQSKGTHAAGFPAHYYAPYYETGVGNLNLPQTSQASGVKYFTLAFVIDSSNCNAAWGGSTAVTSGYMGSDINSLRNMGGDVLVSFGGAAGNELALDCGDVPSLQAQYQSVINQYGITRLDFDVEGNAANDSASIDRRNKAIANLERANSGLFVSYTLAVDGNGLGSNSISILQNAVNNGARVDVVNIMAMDYGSTPQNQMGSIANQAATVTVNQLQSIYPSKSNSQLWAMIGITPMIGVNDTGEIFDLSATQQVTTFSIQHGVTSLAMWVSQRDNGGCAGSMNAVDTCSGLSQNNWDFSHIFNQITGGGGPVATPTPSGNNIGPSLVGKTITLKAAANNNFVSANIGVASNPLQSTAATAQAWEQYVVVDEGNGNIALKAVANNNFVTANINVANAPLQATAPTAQAWEFFQLIDRGSGNLAIKSMQNGLFVTADLNTASVPLFAKATIVQGWEMFLYGVVGATPPTATPKPVATNTPKPVATNTPKPGSTSTPKPVATNTPKPGSTSTPKPAATNTPKPAPTNTATSGASAWKAGVSYSIGTMVTYGGHTYKCIQAHTSQVGWEPPNVPALWQFIS